VAVEVVMTKPVSAFTGGHSRLCCAFFYRVEPSKGARARAHMRARAI